MLHTPKPWCYIEYKRLSENIAATGKYSTSTLINSSVGCRAQARKDLNWFQISSAPRHIWASIQWWFTQHLGLLGPCCNDVFWPGNEPSSSNITYWYKSIVSWNENKNNQITQHFKPLYSGHPLLSTYTNSEDPDEMQHNAAFHQSLHCVCKGQQDLQTKVG